MYILKAYIGNCSDVGDSLKSGLPWRVGNGRCRGIRLDLISFIELVACTGQQASSYFLTL